MTARYQHMTDPIRQDIANRVGVLLWARPQTGRRIRRSQTRMTTDCLASRCPPPTDYPPLHADKVLTTQTR
jgi:hypothetical protein